MLDALIAELASIEDPRCGWKVEHRLLDILVIAVCAVLGEAETFEDIALYGRCEEAWLRGFLALPNGIPSHDTFRRVFTLLDPDAFERCFLGWVRAVFRPGEGVPRPVRLRPHPVLRSHPRRSCAPFGDAAVRWEPKADPHSNRLLGTVIRRMAHPVSSCRPTSGRWPARG